MERTPPSESKWAVHEGLYQQYTKVEAVVTESRASLLAAGVFALVGFTLLLAAVIAWAVTGEQTVVGITGGLTALLVAGVIDVRRKVQIDPLPERVSVGGSQARAVPVRSETRAEALRRRYLESGQGWEHLEAETAKFEADMAALAEAGLMDDPEPRYLHDGYVTTSRE